MTCTSTCIQPSPTNAHCGACHVTFGSVRGFDLHRRGGECYGPALTRMHQDGRGVWRMDGRPPQADAPSADHASPLADESSPGVVPARSGATEVAETLSGGGA